MMQRLTQKDNSGKWSLKGVPWEKLHAGERITNEIMERLYGALFKLMSYEDIGLTPDEIVDLNNFKKKPDRTFTERVRQREKETRMDSGGGETSGGGRVCIGIV